MMRNRKHSVQIKRVTKTTVNDETVMTYSNDVENESITIQYMSDSKIGIEMYGQEADKWLKVFLEKGQYLNVDDLIIIGQDVYRVKSETNIHLRHKTVMVKWDSKNLI